MAVGTKADLQIYPDEFFGGMNEILQQNSEVFNENSNGAMRFITEMIRGDFQRESFFDQMNGLINHRDPTSTSGVSSVKLTQSEFVRPKVNRRMGPVSDTMDAFKKIAEDPSEFSFLVGQQWGKAASVDYVDTGILSTRTAINSNSNLVTDIFNSSESVKTLEAEYLVQAMSNFGDRSGRIDAWVMHSKPWFDLMRSQASGSGGGGTNVAETIIFGGSPGTLGKPVIVTDSDALYESDYEGSGDTAYFVLGLTDSGLTLTQSEDQTIDSDVPLGNENLEMIIQGEYAFNIGVKGFSYTGSANPTDSDLSSSANWDFVMADPKSAAGVSLIVQ